MEDKRNYTVVEAALPTMKALLVERKVDLIPAVIPFAYDPDLSENLAEAFHSRRVRRAHPDAALGRTHRLPAEEPRRHG